ncbi:MAG: glycosyltransferase family 39 protein [Microgenomates group bacterium]
MIRKEKIILFLILLLALGVRLVNVGSHPTFISDEASIGYNAWSILKTGKDEWGNFLPLSFKAFGEYKLPVYIYLTVPFVWILGLSEMAVRLPSVIFGSLTVLLVWFLVKELLENKRSLKEKGYLLPFLAAFLLAISPWHIQTSRMALEANLALFLLILAAFLFLKGLKNEKYFYLSFFLFGLSFYTYNTCRVFTPGLLIGWLFLMRGKIKNFKNLMLPGLIIILVLLSLLITGFRGTGERLAKVGIFSDPGIKATINERRGACLENRSEVVCRIFYNRPIFYSLNFLANWLSHYSPKFLFLKGAGLAQYGVPNRGVTYLFELPLIILGIFWLFQKERSFFWLLVWWILISPIANSFTGPAHPVRAVFLLLAAPILSAGGVTFVWERIKKQKIKTGFLLGILLISFLSFRRFLIDYFLFYPQAHTSTWQAGYRPLYQKLALLEKNYDEILVTKFYGEPHIFYLFYRQYNPESCQKGIEVIRYDREDKWVNVDRIGKYYFIERINPENLKKGQLIAISPQEFNFKLYILDEVKYPNGKTAFLIGEAE